MSIGANAAEISIKNGAISTVNGVTTVDINTANDKGISHNVYDSLNVDKSGLIFNNSKNGANTTLAGQINGNNNLTTGSAKVILNEVTSTKQSALNGVMEVAGDKAHLIIANPNGISCQSCGFINTDKVTVTTGKPDMQADGSLNGYSVNGGIITIGQLQNTSPTEILARSVVVNDRINVTGSDLSVVAGNNYVNTDGQVTGSVTARGSRNTYGVDVAKLGGMYANKINLVSTENGIGVRNIGVIAAGAGGIQIDGKGRLINDNAEIKSSGAISVKTNGVLTNVTGKIMSDGIVSIDTNKTAITNTRAGQIASSIDVYINSGAIDNTNGKIAATNLLAVDTNKNTLTNYGQGISVGIEAGAVALNTGYLMNDGGQIKGYYIGVEATNIDTNRGLIDAFYDVGMISAGIIDNDRGLIRSAFGDVNLSANRVTNNDTKTADTASSDSLGIVAGHDVLISTSGSVDNRRGQIASEHDLYLGSKGAINNLSGKVASNNEIFISGASMDNSQAGLSGKFGTSISVAGNITNYIGVIGSDDGNVNLEANAVDNNGGLITGNDINITAKSWVDNRNALISATKKLTMTSGADVNNRDSERNFGQNVGIYFGMPQQKGGIIGKEGVDITAKNNINNDNSRIVSELGAVKLNTNVIYNTRAMIAGGAGAEADANGKGYIDGNSYLNARDLWNNYSTIYSAGNLKIDANFISNRSDGSLIDNNATGIIASDSALALNIGSSFTNYGWISGKGDTSVSVNGVLYNNQAIASNAALEITTSAGVNNYKDMVAGTVLTVASNGYVNNNGSSSNMVAPVVTLVANGGDVNNRGYIVSDLLLTVYSTRNIHNYHRMFSRGVASITGNNVSTDGTNSLLGGYYGTELITNKLTGKGEIVGL
ncbi:MAG: filamentous hemagglutinin N-terminal domain-containing protein [Enterobacteriaceae bacterium]|nr:filamentous hemagglutinin N-terminal domain-containing protein [Enterobacteriaceae bacterium]